MVIPLRDENPTTRFPIVTIALLVANIAVYFLVQAPQSDLEERRFLYEYAAIPCELTHGEPLSDELAAECDPSIAPPGVSAADLSAQPLFPGKNVWLAALFSMFLHGGLLHLGGNMLFLWVFGNNIEDRLGPPLFAVFYLAAGFAATVAHVLSESSSIIPVIGASGAIAGVMGAYLVWFPHARVLSLVPIFFIFTLVALPAVVVLGLWFVLQFLTSPEEGVAWVAHVGGFAVGAAIAWLLRPLFGPPRAARRRPGPDDWDGGFRGGYPGRL